MWDETTLRQPTSAVLSTHRQIVAQSTTKANLKNFYKNVHITCHRHVLIIMQSWSRNSEMRVCDDKSSLVIDFDTSLEIILQSHRSFSCICTDAFL